MKRWIDGTGVDMSKASGRDVFDDGDAMGAHGQAGAGGVGIRRRHGHGIGQLTGVKRGWIGVVGKKLMKVVEKLPRVMVVKCKCEINKRRATRKKVGPVRDE